MGSPLFEALRRADPTTPGPLASFDRIAASPELEPDFCEHSVRLARGLSPHRLTYYFDTHRRGGAMALETGIRFIRLARELGLPLPPAVASFIQSRGSAGEEVLQVVLGIDASSEGLGLRGKYYLVFQDNPKALVSELFGAAALTPPPGTDLAKTYIVGVDVNASGIDDIKLYFRLDRDRIRAIADNSQDVADLIAESRDVVFLQCTRRPKRRQIYFHAKSTAFLSAWLSRHGFDAALGTVRTIRSQLQGFGLDPFIVSLAYEDRRVRLAEGSVYSHLARI